MTFLFVFLCGGAMGFINFLRVKKFKETMDRNKEYEAHNGNEGIDEDDKNFGFLSSLFVSMQALSQQGTMCKVN